MINFKREYIGLEQDRLLYPVSFKDKAKCNVYGRKKFITEAGEVQLSAHVFLISKDFWTFNAGQLDFTNYPNGIWNDYISIDIIEKDEYTAPSINFGSMGDITPENLQGLSDYISKHLSDLEKRIVEDYLFIDEGVSENIELPNLPENHFWVRKNGVIVGVNLDYLKADYEHFKNELWKNYESFNEKLQAALKKYYDDLELQMNNFFKDLIEKIREEAEKQLGLIAGAGGGLLHKIDQANHGFIFDPIVYENGVWKKATTTSGVDGIGVVISANTFFFLEAGEIEIPKGATDKDGQPLLDDEYYYMNEDGGTGFQKEEPVWFYQPLFHTRTYKGKLLANVHIDTMEDLRGQVVDTESGRTHGIALWGDIVPKFDTIEKLQKAFWLKEGEVVEVLGYYSAGDGAGHKRIIKSEDDGSGVQLANGLWANYIVFDNTVYATHFGVISDGETDNYEKLQKLLDYAQKNSPFNSYDVNIDNKTGNIICSKGLNISSNGYTNTIYMTKGFQYSSRIIFKNPVKQTSAIFLTREKRNDGKFYDRFGREFLAYGRFCLKNLRIATIYESDNTKKSSYSINSDFENGIDITSGAYCLVEDCYILGFSGVGLGIGRWHTIANHNTISDCNIGIGVSISNKYNAGEDLVTNNLIISNNNINHSFHSIKIDNGTFVKIINNTLDISASAGIVGKTGQIICKNNYMEAMCVDDIVVQIEVQDLYSNDFKKQSIKSKTIFYKPSNYNDFTSLIFTNNQIPNNTNYDEHSILAISGIKNLEYKNNSKREYNSNDIQFFGIGANFNNYGILNSKYDIEITNPVSNDSIIYNLISNDYRKSINCMKISSFSKNYLKGYNYFCMNSDMLFDDKFKVIKSNNQNATFNLLGKSICEIDYTNQLCKPYSLKFSGYITNKNEFFSSLDVKIYLDNILKFNEKICLKDSDNIVENLTPCLWLGTDYNKLKIELYINNAESLNITDFCICDTNLSFNYFPNNKTDVTQQLNTLYHMEKMKQEGVYNDFITYMDEKTLYDKEQRKLEEQKQLAYEQALKDNPNLSYEEFMSVQPMTLNLVGEPQPSQALKKFMEKYL